MVNNLERRVGFDLNGDGYIGGQGKLKYIHRINYNILFFS